MKLIIVILSFLCIFLGCSTTNSKSKEGVAGKADLNNISAIDQSNPPELDINAGNIKPGKKYNFEYENTEDVNLTTQLRSFLDALAEYQLENIGMGVIITGHSDNAGTFEQNQKRSALRAKYAADYLVSKGIQTSRVLYSSRGAISPMVANDSEEGRKKNRRIEIEVFAK